MSTVAAQVGESPSQSEQRAEAVIESVGRLISPLDPAKDFIVHEARERLQSDAAFEEGAVESFIADQRVRYAELSGYLAGGRESKALREAHGSRR